MRLIAILLVSSALAGCSSVQARYAKPALFDNPAEAAKLAEKGYAYYTLQKIHVAVEPVEKVSPPVPEGQKTAQAAAKPGQENAKTEKPAADSGKDAGKADKPGPAPPGADEVTQPVQVIDGKVWGAKLSVLSDTDHGFMLAGTNGFWKKTTLSGARAANSDRVEAVTVKAENLTAKRLGQIATVLGYFIKPSATTAAATADTPLKPFDFDVTLADFGADHAIPDTNWTWTLKGPVKLSGTVSFDNFMTQAESGKVNYFPVPACLTADLVVKQGGVEKAAFPLVVSTPELVRLEPMPLDGKLTLSKICSATVEGATQADPYDELFADLAALQAAYEQLRGKKPDAEEETDAGVDAPGKDGVAQTDTVKEKTAASNTNTSGKKK
jgi:hypothetical protein